MDDEQGLPTGDVYGGSPNLFELKPVSSDVTLTSAALDSATSSFFDDPSRLSLSNNKLSFDYGSLPIQNGSVIQIDIGASVASLPAPASAWLFGTGLFSFAGSMRSRRKAG